MGKQYHASFHRFMDHRSETPGLPLSNDEKFGYWSCNTELCKSSTIPEHAVAQLHKTHDNDTLSLDTVLGHPSLKLLGFWLMTEILLYSHYSFLQASHCWLALAPFFRMWHWRKSWQEEKHQYLQQNCCAEPPQDILLHRLQAWKGTMAGIASNTAEATHPQKKEKQYCKV